MRREINGSRCVLTFDSVADIVQTVLADTRYQLDDSPDWYGGVRSVQDAAALAKTGLTADGLEAATISDEVIERLEREQDLPTFSRFYDVSGSDVDVARYLSGEPECMTNYVMEPLPANGRVVSIVACVGATGGVAPETMRAHGRSVMTLLLALEKIGLSVELWADALSERKGRTVRTRVLVKSADAVFDAGNVMYAMTHPSMFRVFCLGSRHLIPKSVGYGLTYRNGGYGTTVRRPDAVEYEAGSVVIPPAWFGEDPEKIVTDALRQIGIIE